MRSENYLRDILLSPFSSISSKISSTSSRVGLSTPISLAICTRTCSNYPLSRKPEPSMSTLRKASSISFFIFLASFIICSNFFSFAIQSNNIQLHDSITSYILDHNNRWIKAMSLQFPYDKFFPSIELSLVFNGIISWVLYCCQLQFKVMAQQGSVLKATQEEELGLLKKQIHEKDEALKHPLQSQQLGQKILMYMRNAFWVIVGGCTLYYSNFFHHLFRNPNINQLFFEISMAGYTIVFGLMIFTSFIMPRISGETKIEDYNPKLIPIGAVVGLVSVISLLIAIWPVWGWWSLPIFVALWKGFFSTAVFLPSGDLGNILFIVLNTGVVLSFYVIQHQGYFH